MSVIVYDHTQQIMTADTRAYSGDPHPTGNKMKIHKIKEGPFAGSLLGITSSQPGMAEQLKQWITEGMDKEAFAPSQPDFEALLVKPDGEIFLFVDAYYPSGPLVGDVFTIGSGKKYALGALRAGANPIQAVEVAIRCDSMCGGPVAALTLHEPAIPDQVIDAAAETPVEAQPQLPFDLGAFSTGAQLTSAPAPQEA